ncbi:rod shape-determining protein [Patescibacteria group bacterium]|nr:rod shape-determining protein [Patescibacteria group bacterium]MBU1457261.1 rod shape-determining protein [Patescibacteria group bacterium]
MFEKLWRLVTLDIGIDLGTANTVVHVRGKGIVIRQPSVVAMHKKSGEVLAIGEEARKMLGKNPDSIEVIRPLKDGVIADFDATEAMLKHYIGQVHETYKGLGFKVPRPRVVIGIPSGVTEVERRAVYEAAVTAGARKVFLVEEPMAAAIGAGMPVSKAQGQMVIDIGGGTTEIGIISLGGLVLNKSLRIAGDELTEAVTAFVRLKHNLLLGESTAETVKLAVGSAHELKIERDGKELQAVVRGRSLTNGLPKSLKLGSVEIREAMMPVINTILVEIAQIIEETPPDLVADILEKGAVLAGGGALIRGIDKLISEQTGMPVWITDNPMEAVVRGCAKVLEDDGLLKKVRVIGDLG